MKTCYGQKQQNMARILKILFVFVSIEKIQASNDSPRLTDFKKLKRSFLAWPANTPLNLKCKAGGTKPLKVNWYKDGVLLRNSRNILQYSQWSLRFRKPKLSDNGVYTCVVSNAFGLEKHSYYLRVLKRVQSAPVLIPGYPKPVNARVGDRVELACIEKPNGQVSDYRWIKTETPIVNSPVQGYKNKSMVVLSPSKYEAFRSEVGGRKLHGVKLHLDDVDENDKGFYTCFVSNSMGYTHSSTYLNVTPILKTEPPEFIIPKEERQRLLVETVGRDAKLSCLVRGGAPLVYTWLFNGKIIKSDERYQIHKSVLILKNVQRFNMGMYTCSISNDFGTIKHDFKLRVLSYRSSYPKLQPGFPKDTNATVGKTVALYCAEIASDTMIDYRWLKWHNKSKNRVTVNDLFNVSLYNIMHPNLHDKSITNKKGIYLRLDNLSVEDEGLYTCLVSNHIGYDYRSAFLSVRKPITGVSVQYNTSVTTFKVVNEINPQSRHCFDCRGTLHVNEVIDGEKECEIRDGPCGSIYNKKNDHWQMFCDLAKICKQHGVGDGGCVNATIKHEKILLCCCNDDFCNKPLTKSFSKEDELIQSSSRPKLMTVIFLSVLLLTFAMVMALLAYRIRRRKAALQQIIIHNTKPSRKHTHRMIMETKWLKEEI